MATVHAAPDPVIDDDVFEEADNFDCRGDWTEDRKEILKDLTGAEIDAEIMRLQAENPGRGLTGEQIRAKYGRTEEAQPAGLRVEMAGA